MTGSISISDLDASGYFGSELSSELGSPILINPNLDIYSSSFVPYNMKLYPAYPNPFNPIVKVPFEINQESDVELSIFDVQGKKVKELF